MIIVKNEEMICDNISKNQEGELYFADMPLSALAEKYGTPLYLYDEERVRHNCRVYLDAVREGFGDDARVMYASKAASFKQLYRIVKEEGLGVDVVSCGEIYTALGAGFPLENAFFHSNNKTDADIDFAIKNGIGYFVVDNAEELFAIDEIAARHGIRQKIMLRITPGIDPHTYAAVATGKVDSKFGSAIETGQAKEITSLALTFENIDLCGFHCHVGSQIFDADVKYGKYLGGIKNTLANIDGNAAYAELKANGCIKFTVNGDEIVLAEEDLLIEMTKKEGYESLGDHGVTVVIDKNLTPELIEEGNVREIISKIQTMRKDSGFEVMDNIRIAFCGNDTVCKIASRNAEEIKDETLGVELTIGTTLTHSKEWSINGEKVTISVEKV